MAYQINKFDTSLLTTLEDGTLDQTTDLKLIGKNYAGYGEIQNENFVFLLENFAGANQPPRPIAGQLWFDTTNSKLKFYDGTKFKTTGGAEVSTAAPVGLVTGDFWWDSDDQQLYAYNGADYTLVGPTNEFSTAANFKLGLSVGENDELELLIDSGIATIQSDFGNNSKIQFKVTDDTGSLITICTIDKNGFLPAQDDTFNIGSPILKWANVYATTFNGVATQAESLRLASTDYFPSLGATNNTVALRDTNGDITANLFNGVASSAKFADLAEVYASDKEYPVGTVVTVGGDAEIRAAKLSNFAIGVISEKPAYLMNSEAKGQAVGLKGRVPVRVKGPVSKGQPVYAWEDGVATTIASNGLVGIALESSDNSEEKLIECVLKV
jgi:hypothetical protein